MTTTLQKILESKRALRRELALRSVGEKLRMLEEMRERERAIRASTSPGDQQIEVRASRTIPPR